jgi:hypothetical protein
MNQFKRQLALQTNTLDMMFCFLSLFFQYRIKKTCCLDQIKFITEDTMVKTSLYIRT